MASSEFRFTVGYTYYEDPKRLLQQIALWEDYPVEVEIVVVDDGSTVYPAEEYLKNIETVATVKLYKVDEDLGFNSHGCRNLIATVASSDFILFLDIDCLLSANDVGYLRTVTFNEDSIYRFGCYFSHNYSYAWNGHVNVFIVNKKKYWEAGGYDESYTGHHYGDREFLEKLDAITNQRSLVPLSINVTRGKRKLIFDSNLTLAKYDNEENTIIVPTIKEKTYAEMKGTVKTKINFSYTQVL